MSTANSAPVDSNQTVVHPLLQTLVKRHLGAASRRPVSRHGHTAFLRVEKQLEDKGLPIILDSGCGTGESSVALALSNPQSIVIGVDKSSHRLSTSQQHTVPDNCILTRATLEDFWQLAVLHHWQLTRHVILYPNPWPKKRHIQRRWHGSAAFPLLLGLGGKLELRTNWRTYALEFAAALNYAGHSCDVTSLVVQEPLTPFEAKYRRSGHTLWRCQADFSVLRDDDL